MLDLSLHYGEGPQALRDVAKRQEISVRYLENIMVLLASGGLVKSVRGKRGGFQLATAPEEIRLSDIIKVTEGSLAPVDCVDDPETCGRAAECVACNIWTKLRDSIEAFLGSVSLADMREMHRERIDELSSLMYYI
jgi:Rrf2 family protein